MSKLKYCFVIFGALSLIGSSCETAATNNATKTATTINAPSEVSTSPTFPADDLKGIMKKSSINKNVQLEVSLPQSVMAFDPIEMSMRLTNLGPQMRTWTKHNGVHELGISVLDAQGTPVLLSDLGRESGLGPLDPFSRPGTARITQQLPPGASQTWQIDLNRYVVLTPGVYTVSAAMEIDEHDFTVSVENVKFTVVAK